MSAQEDPAAPPTAPDQAAAIPTVIECNPMGTSPRSGIRLVYFCEKSVDEVTARLARGAQPMLVGCTEDTINLLVRCPLHGRPATMRARVAGAGGRMTVGYFCKHFSGAFVALMHQCVYCAQVPATETFLMCLRHVGGTTVEVVLACPAVRAAVRAHAAQRALASGRQI